MNTIRPRGRPAKLSKERVLDAAAAFDIRSFSIVKLAESLSVSDAAIYYHFPSKDALIRGMIEREAAGFCLLALDDNWRKGLESYALHLFDALANKPGAAGYLVAAGITGPLQMGIFTKVVGHLIDCGLEPSHSVRIYGVFVRAAIQAAHARDERVAFAASGKMPGNAARTALASRVGIDLGVDIVSYIGEESMSDERMQLEFLLSILAESSYRPD